MSESQPSRTELERLRDILYGDYARDTSVQLDDLEARLATFRQELLTRTSDLDQAQSDQLEVTRQTLEDRLGALEQHFTNRIDNFEAQMAEQLAKMDDQKANRRELGRMLVMIGQKLQEESGD